VNFFFENLSLLPETRAPKEHFKLVFGSGTSDLAKIRPLKVWTSWISPWVPPYGILPRRAAAAAFAFAHGGWRAGRGAGCCRTARRKQSRELFLRLEKRCPTTKRHKIPPPSAHSGGPAPLPRRPRRHAEPAARQAEPPAAPLGVPGVEGPARLLASARGWFGQRTNVGGKRSSAALLAGQRRGRRPPCGRGRRWPALFSIRPM